MPFDLQKMFADAQSVDPSQTNGSGVPNFLQPLPGQAVAMNSPSPDQSPGMSAPPPVQAPIRQPMTAKPSPILPMEQSPDPKVDASSDDTPQPTSLDQYKVTPEELQQARDDKRRALMIGAIAQPLANMQSFGNFYTGHMNPTVDTMGPAKAAAELAGQGIQDKQTLMKQAVDGDKNALAQYQNAKQLEMQKEMSTPGSQIAMLNASIVARVANKAGVPIDEKELAGMSFAQQQEAASNNPILKDAIQEDKQAKQMQAAAMRMQAMGGIAQQRLGLMEDKFAASAGKDVEKSVLPYKNVLNSLGRSLSILNGKEPVTVTDMMAAQQDYVNAIAQGGAATEGKSNREIVHDIPMQLASFQQKFGTQADIRKTDPDLYNHLKTMISKVQGDWNGAMKQQQQATAGNYSSSTSQKVRDTVEGKNNLYKDGYDPSANSSKNQMAPDDVEAFNWAKQNRGSSKAQAILGKIATKYPGAQ